MSSPSLASTVRITRPEASLNVILILRAEIGRASAHGSADRQRGRGRSRRRTRCLALGGRGREAILRARTRDGTNSARGARGKPRQLELGDSLGEDEKARADSTLDEAVGRPASVLSAGKLRRLEADEVEDEAAEVRRAEVAARASGANEAGMARERRTSGR